MSKGANLSLDKLASRRDVRPNLANPVKMCIQEISNWVQLRKTTFLTHIQHLKRTYIQTFINYNSLKQITINSKTVV